MRKLLTNSYEDYYELDQKFGSLEKHIEHVKKCVNSLKHYEHIVDPNKTIKINSTTNLKLSKAELERTTSYIYIVWKSKLFKFKDDIVILFEENCGFENEEEYAETIGERVEREEGGEGGKDEEEGEGGKDEEGEEGEDEDIFRVTIKSASRKGKFDFGQNRRHVRQIMTRIFA